MKIEHLTAGNFITSTWAGGTTTQLYLYPENGSYANRDFLFRISSATVDLEESGFGVLLSAVTVFVYQGTLVLLAGVLQTVLTNEFIIAEMTCVGSLLIIALGLNMLGITKLKVMNYLPAIFFPILFCLFF